MPSATSASPSRRATRPSSRCSAAARRRMTEPTPESSARWPDLAGAVRDGEHLLPVRIYYEDTDFSGVVYHASYLRFMERGRTDYLRLIGADHRALFEQAAAEAPGFAFVVTHMSIDFKRPAFMDDVLTVVTLPEEVKGASVMLGQKVMRGDELLVQAR